MIIDDNYLLLVSCLSIVEAEERRKYQCGSYEKQTTAYKDYQGFGYSFLTRLHLYIYACSTIY